MIDLAVVILTHNEELHIRRALDLVKGIANEVFVVDSFSTDKTVEIAKANGATVLQNKFVNYAKQFQWALDNAPLTSAWIMRLDADEEIGATLAIEISEKLPCLGDDIVGINLKRRHIFLGRWVRFGGRFPLKLLRIWRRGNGRIEDRWMDEHMIVWGGKTVTFEGEFSDHNLNDLSFFVDKHNKYATREALDVLNQKYGWFRSETSVSIEGTSWQTGIRRVVKERIYNRLPFWLSTCCYFLYRYIFLFGFLDGVEGLIYHFMQGFWYRFLVGAKIFEFERVLANVDDKEEKRIVLSRISGHDLSHS